MMDYRARLTLTSAAQVLPETATVYGPRASPSLTPDSDLQTLQRHPPTLSQ